MGARRGGSRHPIQACRRGDLRRFGEATTTRAGRGVPQHRQRRWSLRSAVHRDRDRTSRRSRRWTRVPAQSRTNPTARPERSPRRCGACGKRSAVHRAGRRRPGAQLASRGAPGTRRGIRRHGASRTTSGARGSRDEGGDRESGASGRDPVRAPSSGAPSGRSCAAGGRSRRAAHRGGAPHRHPGSPTRAVARNPTPRKSRSSRRGL